MQKGLGCMGIVCRWPPAGSGGYSSKVSCCMWLGGRRSSSGNHFQSWTPALLARIRHTLIFHSTLESLWLSVPWFLNVPSLLQPGRLVSHVSSAEWKQEIHPTISPALPAPLILSQHPREGLIFQPVISATFQEVFIYHLPPLSARREYGSAAVRVPLKTNVQDSEEHSSTQSSINSQLCIRRKHRRQTDFGSQVPWDGNRLGIEYRVAVGLNQPLINSVRGQRVSPQTAHHHLKSYKECWFPAGNRVDPRQQYIYF